MAHASPLFHLAARARFLDSYLPAPSVTKL